MTGGARPPDVVVIGAGVIGASCAAFASRAGLSVVVVDRGPIAGGTTGAGEGNLLVSDKEPGAELDLALLSHRVWRELGALPLRDRTLGDLVELEEKGGLVVATTATTLAALTELARHQGAAGIESVAVPADELLDVEPNLARDLAGGHLYPQDMQLQPMLGAAALLRLARDAGATVLTGEAVTGLLRDGDRVTGVRTAVRDLPAGAVVNAAGTWAGQVAAMAGADLPVAPRRGFVLVTEPLPQIVRSVRPITLK